MRSGLQMYCLSAYTSMLLDLTGNGITLPAGPRLRLPGITHADMLAFDLYEAARKYLVGQKIRQYNGPKEPDFEENFYILRHTRCAAVLTENMFQDCRKDVEFLQSHDGMEAITMLHVEGIVEYLSH